MVDSGKIADPDVDELSELSELSELDRAVELLVGVGTPRHVAMVAVDSLRDRHGASRALMWVDDVVMASGGARSADGTVVLRLGERSVMVMHDTVATFSLANRGACVVGGALEVDDASYWEVLDVAVGESPDRLREISSSCLDNFDVVHNAEIVLRVRCLRPGGAVFAARVSGIACSERHAR